MSIASWKEGLVSLPDSLRLRELFTYDPESGSLKWSRNNKEAGCRQRRKNGEPNCIRVGIQIGERLMQFVAHRLIFQMLDQKVPDGMIIDHRDGNPFNNRWENLRLSDHGPNICNQRRVAPRKHKIPHNIYPNGSGFFAMVKLNGKHHRSKTTPSLEEALSCRDELLKLHGEFAKRITA